jgi:hypothetical protein
MTFQFQFKLKQDKRRITQDCVSFWAQKIMMILLRLLTRDKAKVVVVFLVSTYLSLEVLISSYAEYI